MKPRNIAIACGVAGVAVGLAAAAGIVYRKQIKSAASLKRLTGYADSYDLYAIDIAYDYDLDRIIAAGVRDDQAYIDAVVAQVLPGVPVHVQAPQFACSAFVAVDAEGRVRTGRNYDFKDDTSALLVRNHPRGGYASIGFLRQFRFERLKLDRSLVRQAGEDDGSRAMMVSSITVARAMAMSVTAEGVETAQQADMVRDAGCDQIQGWLYFKAMPAADIAQHLGRIIEIDTDDTPTLAARQKVA